MIFFFSKCSYINENFGVVVVERGRIKKGRKKEREKKRREIILFHAIGLQFARSEIAAHGFSSLLFFISHSYCPKSISPRTKKFLFIKISKNGTVLIWSFLMEGVRF